MMPAHMRAANRFAQRMHAERLELLVIDERDHGSAIPCSDGVNV